MTPREHLDQAKAWLGQIENNDIPVHLAHELSTRCVAHALCAIAEPLMALLDRKEKPSV
jgi:hypothetical protein